MLRQRHHAPSSLSHEPETAGSHHEHATTWPEPVSETVPDRDWAQITVISGAHLQSFPLAGMAVAHARVLIEQLMSLHPDAPTLVNGRPVEGGYELQAGDTLEFVHHAGEKGHGSWTTA